MKNTIAIIGGTGRAGKFLAESAVKKGYSVRMLVRTPKKSLLDDSNITLIQGDARNPDTILSLLSGCHAVINTFGQPNKAVPLYSEITALVIQTMKELEIKRYVGVTGGSLDIEGDKKSILNKVGAIVFRILYSEMMEDKRKELQLLQASKLDWTLIRLPFVKENEKSKVIKEDDFDMPGFKISSRDIARFMIEQLHNPSYIGKTPFIAN
ncbi:MULTISPECIES: NAD(P)-dependent oxidoreductase [Priestia]|uniref:NAD(P)-dependent oxidoreductase n=1 Tax=Priestia TaxID=2800373 RepID=UPI0011BAEF0F|nr:MULTISPECIES: NAD(P)H-binding protein [Priestia]MBY0065020.1 NAD(P)H-binding protein [Priestia aryabhattai]MDN3363576.1 NAD(P)H-binding protein [Priestia megaterium]QDZ79547.1 NAD-dependent epimerase/dehydratase family protein [Priestia megaterium]WKU25511.1 NAD(P)H-binding protein [Priestia megaterium]